MSNNVKDLDSYLSDPFNQRIYPDLEIFGFDAVKFFDFFYRLVGFMEENKPSAVIQALDEQNWQGGLRLYIIYFLREKYSTGFAGVLDMLPTNDNRPEASLFIIDKEYERLEKLFPLDIFIPDDAPISDRARGVVAIHKISGEAVEAILKKGMEEAERERAIELRARQDERERIEQTQLKVTQEVLTVMKQQRKSPEFTTARQVLAVSYMLKQLGMKNIDKKAQADFIEFLTGKTHRDIYDRVRDPLLVYHKANQDAEYVKKWFQRLGLAEIVKNIEADLSGSAKKKR
jgi:hypothetical protein